MCICYYKSFGICKEMSLYIYIYDTCFSLELTPFDLDLSNGQIGS